jgi:D-aminopeptidase
MEGYWWSLPVVAETWDGYLNDINGFHVKPEHAFMLSKAAPSGVVEEGNVGGGTGMICNEFKGGIGTSSRTLDTKEARYTVGVLVQCNYGDRDEASHSGHSRGPRDSRWQGLASGCGIDHHRGPTDAPLIPTQLKRVVRRVSLGLGRDGSYSGNGSGDIFIAFRRPTPTEGAKKYDSNYDPER